MNKWTIAVAAIASLGMMSVDAAAQTRGEKAFERADTNGDGVVDREEASRMRGERFSRIDLNGDGVVTREELRQRVENTVQQRIEAGIDRRFQELDTDGNGRIESFEMQSRGEGRFDRLDANDDGVLSLEEMSRRK